MSQDKIFNSQEKTHIVNPKVIKTFLDDALSGGGGSWQKLEPKDADLKLQGPNGKTEL